MNISQEQLQKLVEDITRQVVATVNSLTGEDVSPSAENIPLARLIDHTLLKPEATVEQIAQLCSEARQHRFASVCVNPPYVRTCRELLRDVEDVAVCTVIGFPLGSHVTAVKVYETLQAIADGASEIDMVINIGAIKSKDWALVKEDVERVTAAAHAGGALCKVILETGLLTEEEKVMACQICQAAGADFVKTSTGFGPGGATVEDVTLMRQTVGPLMGVKASGGIRAYEDARRMIAAGATRLGASAGVRIMQEAAGAAGPEQPDSKGY